MFFSPSTRGFFDPSINVSMPSDVIEISEDLCRALHQGQQEGKPICLDVDGRPIVGEVPTLTQEQRSAAARARRSQLLAQSDWTQMGDVPGETSALWRPYRSALRHVPGQAGFPDEIDWPMPPS